MKGLKTYFTFLERNKLFTLVNLTGLSISLMFVLLIANMVTRQLTVDKNQRDADHTYLLACEEAIGSHYKIGERLASRYPEIENWCAINCEGDNVYVTRENQKISLEVLCARENFFRFFNYRLLEGNAGQVLADKYSLVLTRTGAQKIFGKEPALGKTVRLSADPNHPYTVTGIMEDIDNSLILSSIEAVASFELVDRFNWASSMNNDEMNNCLGSTLYVRFVTGTDPAQKADDMKAYLATFFWPYQNNYFKELLWIPMHDAYFSPIMSVNLNQYSPTKVWIFLAAGLLILLMAVFNYLSMSVAQTSYRAKEMATRRLLGSSQKEIFWRMMTESFLLTLAAFLIAFLLAKAVEPAVSDLIQTRLNLTGDLTPGVVLLYLAGILLIAAASGFIPATLLSNYHPMDIVKGNFRRKTKVLYLRGLYIIQCGLSIAMLTCAFYLSVQVYRILHTPTGYTYGNVLDYPPMGKLQLTQQFRDAARQKPFVKDVSLSQGTPVSRGNNNTMKAYNGKGELTNISFQILTADSSFLNIFHIPILDDRHAPRTKKYGFFSNSTFEKLGLNYEQTNEIRADWGTWMHVGGRIDNIKLGSVLYPQNPLMMKVLPSDSIRPWNILIEVADGNPIQYKQELDALYSELLKGIPFDSRWYADEVAETYQDLTNMQKILLAFTGAALLISLLGLTAMSLYFITQRKRDMAVRKVFGSDNRREMLLLLRFAFVSLIIGILPAIPLSIIGVSQLAHTINGQDGFGVQNLADTAGWSGQFPWWIPAAALLVVIVISLGSVWLISRKAVRENPVSNLKTE